MELEPVQTKPFFERNWVKYGLIGGGIGILFNVVMYLADTKLLTNQYLGYVPLGIFVIVGILAAVAKKKQQGGILQFGDSVAVSWGSFTTSLVISTIFGIILYFIIDPSILQLLKDTAVERMDNTLAQGKMTQEQYDAGVSYATSTRFFLFVTIGATLLFSVGGLIIYLITSIFIRKEPEL